MVKMWSVLIMFGPRDKVESLHLLFDIPSRSVSLTITLFPLNSVIHESAVLYEYLFPLSVSK